MRTYSYSAATAINDNNSVVGIGFVGASTYHAVEFKQGQIIDLHSQVAGSGYFDSQANGINIGEQICGQTLGIVSGNVVSHAFFRDNSANNYQVTLLNSFAGGTFISANGIAPSDFSGIVGQADTADTTHAFEWDQGDGTPTDLSLFYNFPAGEGQVALAVNSIDDKVGYTTIGNNFYAYYLGDFGFEDLSTGYQDSEACAINNSDQVVGFGNALSGDGSFHALYWQGQQVYDLNSLLLAGSGWQLNGASGINDQGLIVGNGSSPAGSSAFATYAPGQPYTGADLFYLHGSGWNMVKYGNSEFDR